MELIVLIWLLWHGSRINDRERDISYLEGRIRALERKVNGT